MAAPKILTTLLHEAEKRFASEADVKAYLQDQRQQYDALPEDALPGVTVDFPQWIRVKLGCTTTQAVALLRWAATPPRKRAPLTAQDRAEVAQRRSGRKAAGTRKSRAPVKRDTPKPAAKRQSQAPVARETPVTPPPPAQPPDTIDAPSDTGDATPARRRPQERKARTAASAQSPAGSATPTPDTPRRLVAAPTDPIVAGYIPEDLDALQTIAAHYHGERGDFAYVAFRWANKALFGDQLPTTLIQWALTPYGHCIGQTQAQAERYPVVTLHPSQWRGSPRRALDVVIHEAMHVHILYVIGQDKGHSSHDNPTWTRECARLAPLLGLGHIQAAPTKRTWVDGRYTRHTPPECVSMDALSKFPQSLRPEGYYQDTALPWD